MILAKNPSREEELCVKVLLDLRLFSKSPFNWNVCEDGKVPHANFAHACVSDVHSQQQKTGWLESDFESEQ